MKKRTKELTLHTTRGAAIAALYCILTIIPALLGLSSGAIQFRISEALCILPIFFPEAVPGLFIGCLISNLISGSVVWDIIFGSIATLIGAIGARLLRKLPEKLIFITTVPTLLANAIIVPLILIFAYGLEDGYFALMLTVGIGEVVCACFGGTALYFAIKKHIFKK